jgi:hypothetical protein
MTALIRVLRELARLFVDDGALALSVLGIVAAAAIAALASGSWAGFVLLAGSLCVLFLNVMSAARRHRSHSAARATQERRSGGCGRPRVGSERCSPAHEAQLLQSARKFRAAVQAIRRSRGRCVKSVNLSASPPPSL